jgi:hypothetical protein
MARTINANRYEAAINTILDLPLAKCLFSQELVFRFCFDMIKFGFTPSSFPLSTCFPISIIPPGLRPGAVLAKMPEREGDIRCKSPQVIGTEVARVN